MYTPGTVRIKNGRNFDVTNRHLRSALGVRDVGKTDFFCFSYLLLFLTRLVQVRDLQSGTSNSAEKSLFLTSDVLASLLGNFAPAPGPGISIRTLLQNYDGANRPREPRAVPERQSSRLGSRSGAVAVLKARHS